MTPEFNTTYYAEQDKMYAVESKLDYVTRIFDSKMKYIHDNMQALDTRVMSNNRTISVINAELHALIEFTVWKSSVKGKFEHLKFWICSDILRLKKAKYNKKDFYEYWKSTHYNGKRK